MVPGRRSAEAQRAAAERRQREDDAPRLEAVVPRLVALKIAFSEGEGNSTTVEHVRRVVVGRAPALFEQRCASPACKEGMHDLTSVLVSALRQGREHLEGEDPCLGPLLNGTCGWVLRYVMTAEYRDEVPADPGRR